MPSLLLVAHAPLASTLQAIACHAYAECGRELAAVDVPATAGLDEARALIDAALRSLPAQEVLILADTFGATPCNAALAAADGVHCRVVTGVNVPMLWRTLCYAHLPLGELVTRAVDGGRQGVLQVAIPRPQTQTHRPCTTDDPDARSDQQ